MDNYLKRVVLVRTTKIPRLPLPNTRLVWPGCN